MPEHVLMPEIELITDGGRRRRWTAAEKRRFAEETLEDQASVSIVARRNGVAPNLLYRWRRLMLEGGSVPLTEDDDASSIRARMQERDLQPVIPMRKSRQKRVSVDRSLHRLRNLVERCFNKLKNARRVATRNDKTAESFLGFIDITSIRLWLRHLST